jgi:hypothetical protein
MPSNNPNSKPSRQSAYRSAQYARQNPAASMNVVVDLSAFDDVIDGVEGQLMANVRPAAQVGSEILYQAVLRNVNALGKKTGNLASSIYQAFSTDNSRPAGDGYADATYHVSWNATKAPHGHLVEFGHLQKFKVYVGKDGKWYTNKDAPLATPRQVGAKAFVRRAMSEFPRAEEAMAARLLQGVA